MKRSEEQKHQIFQTKINRGLCFQYESSSKQRVYHSWSGKQNEIRIPLLTESKSKDSSNNWTSKPSIAPAYACDSSDDEIPTKNEIENMLFVSQNQDSYVDSQDELRIQSVHIRNSNLFSDESYEDIIDRSLFYQTNTNNEKQEGDKEASEKPDTEKPSIKVAVKTEEPETLAAENSDIFDIEETVNQDQYSTKAVKNSQSPTHESNNDSPGKSDEQPKQNKTPYSILPSPSKLPDPETIKRYLTGKDICHRKLLKHNERVKQRVRRRMGFFIQALESQARMSMMIFNSAYKTSEMRPLFPSHFNHWTEGTLPSQSNDPAVLVRLFTWLLGIEEILENLDENDEKCLQEKIRSRLTSDDEVTAINMMTNHLSRDDNVSLKATLGVLTNDNMFEDYVIRRTYMERRDSLVMSIKNLKMSIKSQLENMLEALDDM